MKTVLYFYLVLCAPLFSLSQSDNPCGAPALPVNTSCSYSGGTNATATASPGVPAPGCANYQGGDVWYTITVPPSGTVTVETRNGVITDGGLAIYSGICGALSLVQCDDDSGPGLMSLITLTGQIPGATLWVRVWEYGNNNNGTFSICASTPPAAPANDNPCSATPLTVNTSCSYTTTTNSLATASPGVPAPGCANYQGGDVWYSITVPATGSVIVETNIGVVTDGGLAIYSGLCGSLSLISCNDDSGPGLMSLISLTGQTPGATLWIRAWEYGNNNNGSFNICAHDPGPVGPCGNPLNNDYCNTPAQLTQGPGNWNSSTSNTYSADSPGNIMSLFCGTIENNSWYQFTALSTTEVFNFTTVNNCTNNDGIQAEVFEVTTNASGCCTNFNSVSNCWSPGTESSGTVTAVGLAIGNSYILMVDGWAGDNCDFTVSNWTASGLLPVELINYHVLAMPKSNVVSWQTASERDNDYFDVMRSFDGATFTSIGKIAGQGNSTELVNYQFEDLDIRVGVVYYRLVQFDFNGATQTSQMAAIDRAARSEGLTVAYPNPTRGNISVEINSPEGQIGTLQIQDIHGNIMFIEEFVSHGFETRTVDIKDYKPGVYFVVYTDFESSTVKKIIKQ